MSIWTHVTGVIRLETGLKLDDNDIENLIRKRILYRAPQELKDEYKEHPERFMPKGSTGSLNFHVYNHENKYELTSCIISIFGDLEDYSDTDEIIEWFKSCVRSSIYTVRQACITVSGLSIDTWSTDI